MCVVQYYPDPPSGAVAVSPATDKDASPFCGLKTTFVCDRYQPTAMVVNAVRTIAKDYWTLSFPLAGVLFGMWLNNYESTHKLATYKNKSMLFQRELKPGEKEPW
ncbi:NDUFB1 [Branchiostoma lanceolatum]|uniref:NDUFB1 protein n=1 Tax=Branchiostoma lanceolatum TaxID=7740 RepID=A0A8J9ZVB8_BRALA|nr:NDUFB1 [Branchiostoma lanceolatum]